MITHPIYDELIDEWIKFRKTYKGGKDFIKEYIIQRPGEKQEEFDKRLKLSHCPAHAKANLNEIKNSIFTRISQGVSRIGGSMDYQSAVLGQLGGVDRQHSSMTGFIGSKILPDLLSIGKVGIWVDAPATGGQPYFNTYRAEDILSWVDDSENPGHFSKILLRRHTFGADEKFGFPSGSEESYRAVIKTDDGISVIDFNEEEEVLNTFTLFIDSIPFVIAELSESLLTDVADYQISMSNLDSSDIAYCWYSNGPLYTEQVDQNDVFDGLMNSVSNTAQEGETSDPVAALHGVNVDSKRGNQRRIGATEGVGYSKGLERPGFISPPSDPLRVSMEKQEVMRNDIRSLINLSLTSIKPRSASAESKEHDERGLEAGLSAIGLELQALENRLAELWAMYEETEKAQVNYPDEYELKSDSVRRSEAEDLIKLKENFPSQTAKKIIIREAAKTLLAGKIKTEELKLIEEEINANNGCTGNPEAISRDLENGLVTAKTASLLRGYSEGESINAQKEKAQRMADAMRAQRGSENFEGAKDRGEGQSAEEPEV